MSFDVEMWIEFGGVRRELKHGGSFLEIDQVARCSPDAKWRHAQGSGDCPSCVAFKKVCAKEAVTARAAERFREAVEEARHAPIPRGTGHR